MDNQRQKVVNDTGLTNFVDNIMCGKEAVKLSIPTLHEIANDKWYDNLWDDTGNINGNKAKWKPSGFDPY